jgi:hypothetical protein
MEWNTTDELHDDTLLVLDENTRMGQQVEKWDWGIGVVCIYKSSSWSDDGFMVCSFVTSGRSFRRRFLVRCHIFG